MKNFFKDESGQTTTEYILMLAVLVTIFVQFKKSFKKIINNLLGNIEASADKATSDADD